MSRTTRPLGALLLALALAAGAVACGEPEPQAAAPSAAATATPTGTPTTSPGPPVPVPSLGPIDRPTPSAIPGLDEGFPVAEVPLIAGVVTGQSGGDGPDGRKGWIFEVSAAGSQEVCFDDAAAALVARGFTKQGELVAGDTRQAQFTSPEYAVIISARDDGDEFCQVGYEVGQVSP